MRASRKTDGFCRADLGRYLCALLAVFLISLTLPNFAEAEPVYTTLHAFTGSTDGTLVGGDGLIRKGSVLYGVAAKGGRSGCPAGCGLVYTLTPTADPQVWEKRTIYSFVGGGRGYWPRGQLQFGSDGALYGAASRGGLSGTGCSNNSDGSGGCGLIYKLTAPETAGQPWTQTVLYRFKNSQDGNWPIGGLVVAGGALYGTTNLGGGGGLGTAFRLTASSDPAATWIKTTLAAFSGGAGASPNAALTLHNGKFYGTTSTGVNFAGSVFELAPPAPGKPQWTLKILHKFIDTTGTFPAFVKIVFDGNGRLYGTASKGGADCTGGPPGCGVVFQMTPPSPPGRAWAYHVIHRFRPGSDGFAGEGGGVPVGGIAFDAAGTAYGVTSEGGENKSGVIYKLTPPAGDAGSWAKTVLYNNISQSNRPQAPVIVAGPFLYGTLAAELFGNGEVFRLEQ